MVAVLNLISRKQKNMPKNPKRSEMKRRLYGRPVSKLFDDKLPNDFFDCDDPEDLFTEGVELINGFDEDKNSVPQDIDKGIALITMAAEQGYAKVQTVLGLCYEETDKP